MQNKLTTPELLAPAGTPEALSAAVAAGADAVYFGVGSYNARMNARNFNGDELHSALSLCHAHGVKAHVTLNTQLYDRELSDAMGIVETLYAAGVDALIVADLGLATLIHKYFPDFELHASTQASGHSLRDAEYFASLGFSRMVVSRETSRDNIAALCASSPIDVEMFVHGANCVSFSGQCLMSSLIGGRSGNRGECAQPCRLGYNGSYPLSPKDLCLAEHIKDISSLGVASLKIEGRMKSPDYVYRVVSVYRRLLDEKRNASAKEMAELYSAFSRSGFTDGFFTKTGKQAPNTMLGIRTDADKAVTKETEIGVPTPTPVKITSLSAEFLPDTPSSLTLATAHKCVTVTGAVPEIAKTRPMTEQYAITQLCKLGGTPYTADSADVSITVGDGIMLPASALNELRRRAVTALGEVDREARFLPEEDITLKSPAARSKPARVTLCAEFLSADAITESARSYFDRIYLPLDAFERAENAPRVDGVILPPIIYDDETENVRRSLEHAVKGGVTHAVIAHPGQIALLRGLPLIIVAGYRCNVNNSNSAQVFTDAGVDTVTLSPELTLPQMRDISRHANTAVTVYGRIPLMTTERCIVRAVCGDKCVCKKQNVTLTDRMGARFPVRSIPGCRNVIYNSVPLYMADKQNKLDAVGADVWHFMFTTENADEVNAVVSAYKNGDAAKVPIRRIK